MKIDVTKLTKKDAMRMGREAFLEGKNFRNGIYPSETFVIDCMRVAKTYLVHEFLSGWHHENLKTPVSR